MSMEMHVLDTGALQRQSGLEAMLGGNATIAAAMSPESHYSVTLKEGNPADLIICQDCALLRNVGLGSMLSKSEEIS